MPAKTTLLQKVMRLTKVAGDDECWLWGGQINNSGYGILFLYREDGSRTSMTTSKAMWTAINGEVPKGISVCHTCDNKICVNPKHLWLGAHLENIRDMVNKGRVGKFRPGRPFKHKKEDVIKAIGSNKKVMDIAAEMNVHRGTVSRWIKGLKKAS